MSSYQHNFFESEKGSPLIIYEAAERWIPDRYEAIFANKEREGGEAGDMASSALDG